MTEVKDRRLQGDEGALFEEHSSRLLRVVARSVSVPPHVVDEACGFAWLQLVRTQPRRESVFAWLKVVACREAIRVAGRERREVSLEGQLDGGSGEPSEHLEKFLAGEADVHAAVELREVLDRVGCLPERRRRIFLLHLAGHSYGDITATTGNQPRAIDRQIRKARTRLREGFLHPAD